MSIDATKSKGNVPLVAEIRGEVGQVDECKRCGSVAAAERGRTRCTGCLILSFAEDRVLTSELLLLKSSMGELLKTEAGASLVLDFGALRQELDRFLATAWRPRLGALAVLWGSFVADDGLRRCMLVRSLGSPFPQTLVRLEDNYGNQGHSVTLSISKGEHMCGVVDIHAPLDALQALLRWASNPELAVARAEVQISLVRTKDTP